MDFQSAVVIIFYEWLLQACDFCDGKQSKWSKERVQLRWYKSWGWVLAWKSKTESEFNWISCIILQLGCNVIRLHCFHVQLYKIMSCLWQTFILAKKIIMEESFWSLSHAHTFLLTSDIFHVWHFLQPVVLRKLSLGLWDTDMSRYFIFRELLLKHSEF